MVNVGVVVPSSPAVAGEPSYTVSCVVTLPDRFIYQPRIVWSHNEAGNDLVTQPNGAPSFVMTGNFSADLTFSPVVVSDEGPYYCVVFIEQLNVTAVKQYDHSVLSK